MMNADEVLLDSLFRPWFLASAVVFFPYERRSPSGQREEYRTNAELSDEESRKGARPVNQRNPPILSLRICPFLFSLIFFFSFAITVICNIRRGEI